MKNILNLGLENKSVFVAGGAGDIGEAIVETFAQQGSRVTIADLNGKKAEEIARGFNAPGVSGCALDITSEVSIKQAIEFAKEKHARIDVLVNVAGILCRKSFFETTKDDFDESFGVNVTGMFLVSREIAQLMRICQTGTIVNISSMNGKLTVENRCLYSATKAAVNMLTQSMALELGPFGINVNAVAPGIVDSKMARVRLNTPELVKQYTDSIPLRALTLPSDVAHCVAFLASPYAKNISGETIVVDGALTVRMPLPKSQ